MANGNGNGKNGKNGNGTKKGEHQKHVLIRAERIWKLVNIEGYSYCDAWKTVVPISKAKKPNWSILGHRSCDVFEEVYGDDLKKLLKTSGLGLPKVVKEIRKALSVKKVELFKGKVIKDKDGKDRLFDDNPIQQRGRELLTKVHGLDNQKIEFPTDLKVHVTIDGKE